LTTGVKVAIGCGVALLLVGVVAIVLVGAGAYWVKGKTESLVAGEKKIDDLKKKANANPFTRPADGVLSEPRFETFLEVRKRVYGVYEKNQAVLEGMKDKKNADLGDVKAAFGVVSEVRTAQAQALADLGMSEDEYRFMVESVYKSAWAAAMVGDSGKKPSEVAAEGMKQAQEAVDKAMEEAKKQGVPGAADAAREGMAQAHKEVGEAMSQMEAMDVPPANIALFKKHADEIKKYAMGGLELIGL
jgi:hypothetical protein